MDLLIKLYGDFPELRAAPGVVVRKPLGPEHRLVAEWAGASFNPLWASEAQAALANRPVTLFVAQRDADILGFCCYDATARGFVGPIGVCDAARGQGVGSALLLASLHDMRAAGYGYAVVGDVGAPEFFRRIAGAIEIPDSTPGLYAHLLR